jgi:uncharacterized protein YeeX (DUF496 family)
MVADVSKELKSVEKELNDATKRIDRIENQLDALDNNANGFSKAMERELNDATRRLDANEKRVDVLDNEAHGFEKQLADQKIFALAVSVVFILPRQCWARWWSTAWGASRSRLWAASAPASRWACSRGCTMRLLLRRCWDSFCSGSIIS